MSIFSNNSSSLEAGFSEEVRADYEGGRGVTEQADPNPNPNANPNPNPNANANPNPNASPIPIPIPNP